jgi:hypothetical protein
MDKEIGVQRLVNVLGRSEAAVEIRRSHLWVYVCLLFHCCLCVAYLGAGILVQTGLYNWTRSNPDGWSASKKNSTISDDRRFDWVRCGWQRRPFQTAEKQSENSASKVFVSLVTKAPLSCATHLNLSLSL